MNPGDRDALARYRIEKAHRTLREAETLAAVGAWAGMVNRAYYAMFYAAVAMLATRGLSPRKHTGLLMLVDRELVDGGLVPAEHAAHLREAFRMRQRADYADEDPVTAERGEEILTGGSPFPGRCGGPAAGPERAIRTDAPTAQAKPTRTAAPPSLATDAKAGIRCAPPPPHPHAPLPHARTAPLASCQRGYPRPTRRIPAGPHQAHLPGGAPR